MKVQRWTPEELLARIADSPHELSLPAEFSEVGRANVKELLDATVRVLDEESRKVFLAFGAFSTPKVTVEMLAQYCYSIVIWGDEKLTLPAIANDGFGRDSVRTALQNLELNGLAVRLPVTTRTRHSFTIKVGQGTDDSPLDGSPAQQTELVEHYRVHDLAYRYVRGQTGDDLRKKALDICLAYTFFHAEPGPLTYESLRSEIDNLLGAASFALDHGYYHYVERFADNLYIVSRFLDFEGAHLQAIRLLEQAVDAAAKRGDTEARYRQLGNLGKAYLQSGDQDRSLQTTKDALAFARQEKDERVEQLMLTNLGASYLSAREIQQAYEYLQQGLKIAVRRGDRRGQGQLFGNLGLAHDIVGMHKEAYGFYKEAVEIAGELGDDESAAIHLGNLASLFLTVKEYQNAEQVAGQSIGLFKKLGNRSNEASVWHTLGFVYRDGGNVPAAIQAWTNACDLYRAIGNEGMVQACLNLIAQAGAAAPESSDSA
jgi:tetratricopeptide (TPR) repeat protein